MDLISEGKAKFYASRDKNGKISRELEVFYNPVMKFNRDVSILLLNNCGLEDLQVADIMAGSGVRSIRFLLELKKGILKNIVVNDYDKNFPKTFSRNLKVSNLKKTKNIVVSCNDAKMLLLESKGFDYIDVDPFGSPNAFLDLSIVRLSRGGILAVTATDTAPLSGTFPATCQRNYWAKPLHNELMHEAGLRILIRKIQLVAAQYDKALVPIYSYFKDHYFRIFFKCTKTVEDINKLLMQHKYLLYCNKCMNFEISEFNNMKCSHCDANDSQYIYAGPMWTGRLFDEKLAQAICKDNTFKENERFLDVIRQESQSDIIGFHDIHELCQHYKKQIPNFEVLIEKIRNKGYFVSRTHFTLLGIKTDMPLDELLKLI